MLARPPGAWLAFNLNLLLWHLPGAYDLTLRNLDVHVLEHTTFLVFGILFWAQVIGAAPASARLSYAGRIADVAGAIVPNVALSMYLAFAQHPLYAPYAMLAHRPGGISALADQQIGAGIMWTAGDLPFAIAIAVLVERWFAENEAITARLGDLAVPRSPAIRPGGSRTNAPPARAPAPRRDRGVDVYREPRGVFGRPCSRSPDARARDAALCDFRPTFPVHAILAPLEFHCSGCGRPRCPECAIRYQREQP